MFRSIFSIIVITLSALFAVFYVKPMYSAVEGHKADQTKIEQTTKDSTDLGNLIATASTTLDSFRKKNYDNRLDIFLPETIDHLRLANNIKYMGQAEGLSISDVKVEERKDDSAGATASKGAGSLGAAVVQSDTSAEMEKKGYVATKVSFTVVATYPVFQRLLGDIEDSLQLMDVTSLTFQEAVSQGNKDAKAVANAPLLYQYTVELETYSLK